MTDRNSPRAHGKRDVLDGLQGAVGRVELLREVVHHEHGLGRRAWTGGSGVSLYPVAPCSCPLVARLEHGVAHGRRVARLDAHIDDGDATLLDGSDGLRIGRCELVVGGDRAETEGALRAGQRCQIDVGLASCAGRSTCSRPDGCACAQRAPGAPRRCRRSGCWRSPAAGESGSGPRSTRP